MMKYKILWLFLLPLTGFGQEYIESWNKGNKAYEEEKYEEAIKAYEGVKTEGGKKFEGVYNKGNALYRSGDFKSAEAAFREGVELAPTKEAKAKAYYNLGNSQVQNQNLGEAIKSFQQALINNPNDEQSRENLYRTLKQLKKQSQQQKGEENQQQGGEQQDQDQENQEQSQESKQEGEQKDDPMQENDENDDGNKKEDQNIKKDQPEEKDNQAEKEQGEDKESEENKPGDDEDIEAKGGSLTKDQAEKLLDMIGREEEKVKEKVDKKTKKKRGEKSEKDW